MCYGIYTASSRDLYRIMTRMNGVVSPVVKHESDEDNVTRNEELAFENTSRFLNNSRVVHACYRVLSIHVLQFVRFTRFRVTDI